MGNSMHETAIIIDNLLRNDDIYEASKSVTSSVLDKYYQEVGSIHLPTVIGALAALIGERVIRHCHPHMFSAEPQFIRSNDVEDFIFRAQDYNPTVCDILIYLGQSPNFEMDRDSWFDDIVLRTTSGYGGNNFPVLSIRKDYYPMDWSPNAQIKFRELVDFTIAHHNINDVNIVYMLAVGLGNVIDMAPDITEEFTDKTVLTQLALEIAYGCASMTPLKALVEYHE